MMSSLYVRNIPTICIDGQIKFVSRIPPREELVAAIQERVRAKMSLKIKCNHGKIILLGAGDEDGYAELRENIELGLKEIGATSSIEFLEINDEKEMRSYGVFNTPAVVTEKRLVKSAGKVVEKNVVKEWIKNLY